MPAPQVKVYLWEPPGCTKNHMLCLLVVCKHKEKINNCVLNVTNQPEDSMFVVLTAAVVV